MITELIIGIVFGICVAGEFAFLFDQAFQMLQEGREDEEETRCTNFRTRNVFSADSES